MTPAEALAVLRAALAAWPGSLEVRWALDDLAAFVERGGRGMDDEPDDFGDAIDADAPVRRIECNTCGRVLVGEMNAAGVWELVWPRAFPKEDRGRFAGLSDASPAIEAFEAWAAANPAPGWKPKRKRGAA